MRYRKTTITEFSISGGFILAVVIVILIAAEHKSIGPAVNTAVEFIKWTAIIIGSMMGLGVITGLTYLVIRARRVVKRARARRNGPQTITLYPSYVLNNEPVAEIAPARIWHEGEEYVKVIKPDKIRRNSEYGRGNYNG